MQVSGLLYVHLVNKKKKKKKRGAFVLVKTRSVNHRRRQKPSSTVGAAGGVDGQCDAPPPSLQNKIKKLSASLESYIQVLQSLIFLCGGGIVLFL